MTKCVCKWKPFWVPRGDTFQNAYLEETEQEDDVPSHTHAGPSKNSHRSRSFSRTTASESFQAVKDDAPCGGPSMPQSSWQPVGDTNEPTKLWKHTETQKKCSVWEPMGAAVPLKTCVRIFFHPVQFGGLPKRLSLPYPDAEICYSPQPWRCVGKLRDIRTERVSASQHQTRS